jgi:uncharacterized protein (TIGR01777 family)
MRILITGGTGFIGRALCPVLSAEGHQLTVLSRRPDAVASRCGVGVTAMAALTDWRPDRVFDAVINLAGEPIIDRPWTARRQQQLLDSRVALTETLVDRMRRAQQPPQVLLSGSAIGIYGDAAEREFDETAAINGDDFAARLCAEWEAAASVASTLGVRVCRLRTGLVLAADGGLLGRMRLPFALGLGARLGSGQQWMSWVHRHDFIRSIQFLLTTPNAVGAFNLTAPAPARNVDFTRQLSRALGRRAPWVAPGVALKLALGRRAYMLLGGQRVVPNALNQLGFVFQYPDLAAALADLLPR